MDIRSGKNGFIISRVSRLELRNIKHTMSGDESFLCRQEYCLEMVASYFTTEREINLQQNTGRELSNFGMSFDLGEEVI